MKKIINKNTIFGFIIGLIVCGVTVYAATNYMASQITYGNNGKATVEAALDDLYTKANKQISFTKYDFSDSYGDQTTSRSTQLDLQKGKYIVFVEQHRSWINPSATSVSRNTTTQIGITCTNDCISQNISNYGYLNRSSGSSCAGYPRLNINNSIYYVQVGENGTTITTTWSLNNDNIATENIILTAIKVNE